MINVSRDGLVHVLQTGEVADVAAAKVVVDALKGALAEAVKAGDYIEFRHRIVFQGKVNGSPVPDNAMHMDMVGDAQMADAMAPGQFWLHVAGLPGGADVVRDWLDHVDAVYVAETEKLGFEAELWEAGEVGLQLGESAVMPLMLQDAEWIDAYIRLMERWDLGHEVNQGPTIDAAFTRYGWTEAVERLLIARVVVDSQHGAEQVFDAMRGRLSAAMDDNALNAFYRKALAAFHEATKDFMEWPPNDDSAAVFGITGPLRNLAAEIGA